MGNVVPLGMEDAHAAYRRDFPSPAPLHATIELTTEEAVEVVARMPKSRRDALRGLFPGLTDEEIVISLIDELFDRFGID